MTLIDFIFIVSLINLLALLLVYFGLSRLLLKLYKRI